MNAVSNLEEISVFENISNVAMPEVVVQPEQPKQQSGKSLKKFKSELGNQNISTIFATQPISKERYHYNTISDGSVKRDKIWSMVDQLQNDMSVCARFEELFSGIFFKMKGVALIATYLKAKKNLEGLYVCDSLEAFQNALEEINETPENQRVALIIPCDFLPVEAQDTEYKGNAWHKLCVCVEKLDGQLRIVIIDSIPDGDEADDTLSLAPFEADAQEAKKMGVSSVPWYLCHAKLDWTNTTIYDSIVRTQSAGFGCDTFALKTGQAFLETPSFFDEITTKEVRIEENDKGRKFMLITSLPPAFMKGTQSLKRLNAYLGEHPDAQLKSCVERHTVAEEDQKQNHYIQQRAMKYKWIGITSVLVLDQATLVDLIGRSLITASRVPLKEGEKPRTLSEAHL